MGSYLTVQQDSLLSFRRDQIDVDELMEQYHLRVNRDTRTSVKYEYLNEINVMDLLETIKHVKNELLSLHLESYIYISFFKKHDAKVIKILAAQEKRGSRDLKKPTAAQRRQSATSSVGGQSVSTKKSVRRMDHGLSLMHKRELAERLTRERSVALNEMENAWKKELCNLRAKFEEAQLRKAEVIESENSFLLHFENQTFSDEELSNKFAYFTHSYISFSQDWMSSIRLKICTLNNDCRHIMNDIRIKKDKRMSLTSADLEKIDQRLECMFKEYNGKVDCALLFKHNVLVKTTEMNKETKALANDTIELKLIREQTAVVEKICKHMKGELQFLDIFDQNLNRELYEKKQFALKYRAPSTDEYITIKEKCSNLVREVEILRRKISVLNISLPISEQIVMKKKQKIMLC